MEIIYVYIKKYKNIENVGFNLSPNFEVIREENEVFTINRKDIISPYLKNINIRAIIGKNGSGKTALLEFLMLLSSNLYNLKKLDGFILFLKDKKFYVRKENNFRIELSEELKENYSIEILENNSLNILNEIYSINFNYAIDYPSTVFLEIINENRRQIKPNKIFYPNKRLNFVLAPVKSWHKIDINSVYKSMSTDYFQIKKALNFSDKYIGEFIKDSFDDDNFVFYPYEYKLEINKTRYIFELQGIVEENFDLNLLLDSYKEVGFDLFRLNKYNMNENRKKLFLLGLIYLTLKYKEIPSLIPTISWLRDIFGLVYRIGETEEKYKYIEKLKTLIKETVKLIEDDIHQLNLEALQKYIKNFDIPLIKYMEYVRNQKQSIDAFISFYEYDYGGEFLLNSIPSFINIDLKDKEGRLLSDLSFGEKLLSFLFLKILRIVLEIREIYQKRVDTINIFYDEFDIGLHPEMQRKFLNFMLRIIKILREKLDPNIYFNVFISTHSPFIISDIPKENITFLDKGREVKEFEDFENTFGANLYDILDKGFFLENSVGEYSEKFIKSLSTVLSFTLANLYFINYENKFPLLRLLELSHKEEVIDINKLNKSNLQSLFRKNLEKLVDKEFLNFFVKNECNDIKTCLKEKQIKFYIENLIGEPVLKNNFKSIFEEILHLKEQLKNES